jgi:hypothetical protein
MSISDEPLLGRKSATRSSFLGSIITNRLFLLAPACAAIVGFAVHASLLFRPNFAGYVVPQTRSCLMTLFVMFFCAEGFLLQFRSPSFFTQPHRASALVCLRAVVLQLSHFFSFVCSSFNPALPLSQPHCGSSLKRTSSDCCHHAIWVVLLPVVLFISHECNRRSRRRSALVSLPSSWCPPPSFLCI